jgi:signal recognition particle receptor subunit beta
VPAAKLLVLGGPGGSQGAFVAAISEVKVRSSTRTPQGEGFVPMDFGRLKLDEDLDLQVFGVERDQVDLILGSISPGIVGAIVLVGRDDLEDPHYSVAALEELSERGIAALVAATEDLGAEALDRLANGNSTIKLEVIDRPSAKTAIVTLLESVLESVEGTAA